jgi:hypothetical protein
LALAWATVFIAPDKHHFNLFNNPHPQLPRPPLLI